MVSSTSSLGAVVGDNVDRSDLGGPRLAAMWAYAVKMGASPDDASDAVQEAWARLLETEANGQLIVNRQAWLYAVVHRLVVDEFRWRNRVRNLVDRLSGLRETRANSGPPPDPDDEVWIAVDSLPMRQRAAVYLRYRADMDFNLISTVLGVSEGAARSYVSKGIARLEVMLASTRSDR